jgi:hypothetical protein
MTKELEQYLNSDAAAGKVMAHARLLIKLSRRFEAIAPSGFRHAARVANYKSGKIIIHADNGAVAAKIRQMGQRLCDELSKSGAECNGIEVKVQPRQIPYQSISSTQKPLSAKACGVLRSTSENLPKGPLRDALDRLLRSAAKQENSE